MPANYKVKIIDPLKDPRWDRFVLEQKEPTIFYHSVFHHSAWAELLQKSFKHMQSMYFILEDDKNQIAGGIPLFLVKSRLTGNRLVSVPFASACIPLVSNLEDFEQLTQAITEKLKEHQCSYLAMKMRDHSDLLNNSMLKKFRYCKSHVLAIDKDLDTLKKSFHKTSIQQRLTRAERAGFVTRVGTSLDDMRIFHHLFTLDRVKKVGRPPHPYRYFKNMWEILYPKDMLSVHLLEHEGKTIGGMLLYKIKNTVLLQHGVSDKQYNKYGPTQFLIWKAIQLYHKEGLQFFDLGQAGLENKGLIEFKRRWQPKEYDLFHLYYPDIKGVYSTGHQSRKQHLINMLIRHTPLPIAKIGGNILYNHMG